MSQNHRQRYFRVLIVFYRSNEIRESYSYKYSQDDTTYDHLYERKNSRKTRREAKWMFQCFKQNQKES